MVKRNYAVIFDMDGVIVDSNPFHRKAWKLFCKTNKLNISENDLRFHVYGKTNTEILSYLFSKKLTKTQFHAYAEEKESLYRKLFGEYILLTEGLLDFLKLLHRNKIKRAIATSAPSQNVDFILRKTGITKYFKTIIDESYVTNGKPHPEIYLKTAKKLQIDPTKCVVFEDSLSGIISAINAGMKVVAITTTHSKKELSKAHFIIKDFTEVNLDSLLNYVSEGRIL